ncbi:MAG: glycosyltransferase family 4 protein, partial [Bacillota bacterium]|nr:glycosyltransferase family 4 protein [Bacillota bacterium]
ILAHHPNTKFVIGGNGPHEESLRNQARALGVENRVYFTDFLNEETRNSLYNWANVAVFPSLYEPFGIVALEAMAARTPVVVADTGGMSEIIDHGVEGLKVYPGDAHSLALNINLLLGRPDIADKLKERAYHKVVEHYDWRRIARRTKQTYREVWTEHQRSEWVERPRIFGKVYQMLRYS